MRLPTVRIALHARFGATNSHDRGCLTRAYRLQPCDLMTPRKLLFIALLLSALVRSGSAHAQGTFWDFWRVFPLQSTTNEMSHQRTGDRRDKDKRIWLFRITPFQQILWNVWTGDNDAIGKWDTGFGDAPAAVFGEGLLPSVSPPGPREPAGLVAVGGEWFHPTYGIYMPRFDAMFDFTDAGGASQTATPWWSWLPRGYTYGDVTPPVNPGGEANYIPYSGISWWDGPGNARVSTFGLTVGDPSSGNDQDLREYSFDGTSWTWTDHARPSGSQAMHMGPKSAVILDPAGAASRYVFVTADSGGLLARAEHLSACIPAVWCWMDLGSPPRTLNLRTPVAFSYFEGGAYRITVFVSGEKSDGFHLFERHFDGNNWLDWYDHGKPPLAGLTPRPGGFDMTTGVVWHQTDADGVQRLRISVFGDTDPWDRFDGQRQTNRFGGGELVEFHWDGFSWSWKPLETLPTLFEYEPNVLDPTRWRVMSSSVIDTLDWDRISVFGISITGLVWERFHDGTGWQWKGHTEL